MVKSMMDNNIIEFKKFLNNEFHNLKDIVSTFEECSKDSTNHSFLVSSKQLTINFDKLTEWEYGGNLVSSADSMSFTGDSVYLIEFKSGDPTVWEKKFSKLTSNVIKKINDSDKTISNMYLRAFNCPNKRLKQLFCLVVDSKKMGITPLVSTLSAISLKNNSNDKEKKLINELLPNMLAGVKNPTHYHKIDIWYSELFDLYLSTKGIDSFS